MCEGMQIHACVWGGNANWGAGFGTNEAPQTPIFGVDFSGGFTSPIQFQTCPEVCRDKAHKARPQDPGTLPLPAVEAWGRTLPLCRILWPRLYSEGLEPDDPEGPRLL